MLIYHSKPTKAIDLFTDILMFDQQCLKRYGTLHDREEIALHRFEYHFMQYNTSCKKQSLTTPKKGIVISMIKTANEFAKLYKITVEILQKCNEQKIHSYRMIFLDKRKLSIKQLQKKRFIHTVFILQLEA